MKHERTRRSLKDTILWCTLAVVCGPALIAGALGLYAYERSFTGALQTHEHQQAHLVAAAFDEVLAAVEGVLQEVRSALAAAPDSAHSTILEEIRRAQPLPLGLFLADTSGAVFASSVPLHPEVSENIFPPHEETSAGPSPVAIQWSTYEIPGASPRHSLRAKMTFSEDRSLSAHLPIGYLFEAVSPPLDSQQVHGLGTGSDTAIWEDSSTATSWISRKPSPDRSSTSARGGQPIEVEFDGQRFLGAVEPLEENRWAALAVRPASVVMQPLRRAAALAIAGFLLSVLFAAWVARQLYRFIAHPLRDLQAQAGALAGGEFHRNVSTAAFKELREFEETLSEAHTILRRRESHLINLQRELETTFNSASDGVFICQADETSEQLGGIIAINPIGCAICDKPREEILGHTFASFFRSPVATSFAEELKKLFTADHHIFEVSARAKPNLHFEVNGRTFHYRDELRVILTTRDITARARTENALIEAKEAAEATERSDPDFRPLMVQEIRAPLVDILHRTEVLAGTLHTAENRADLAEIATSGERLLNNVDGLLRYLQMVATDVQPKPRSFSLEEFFEELCHFAAARIQRPEYAVPLETHYDKSLPPRIIADRDRLREIVEHLLENAVRSTTRGPVRLSFRKVQARGTLNRLTIEVGADGAELPEAALPGDWRPFAPVSDDSSSAFQGGSALDLAIARRLTDVLEARLSVRMSTRPGEGNRFRLEHPLRLPPPVSPLTVPDPALSRLFGDQPPKIICAEDNAANRAVLEAVLRKLHLRAEMVEHGGVLLQQLREQSFDLALMDLQMPVLDGIETSRRIRAGDAGEKNRGLYIAALTAHADISVQEKCYAVGMNDFLAKPVRITQLRDAFVRFQETRNGNDSGDERPFPAHQNGDPSGR